MKANKNKITRRIFLHKTSLMAAGTVAGALAPNTGAKDKKTTKPDASKTLSYNPKMGYRLLGKTGIMISEISLGGHGGFYEEGGVENRRMVLDRATESGMNYVDTNIAKECELYGKAMDGKRRKNWYIGFASWPQKITEEYEKELSKAGMIKSIEDRLKGYKTDYLDIWRPCGATWGEGQKNMATMLMVSHRVLDMVVDVFEKVRKQGKVRWLGISAHNPKVFRRVLNEYPQFSVIIFPYLFLTKELGGDSLLDLAKKKDVGVIGLKPFGAGTTFNIRPSEISGQVDKRAANLLKEMLAEPRISAVIPGVNIPEQLDENVRGSYERNRPVTSADREAIRQCTENYYANLTPEYQWLRHWERV
ncbi:MAG: aldo/keto reductase [Planctomycetota bacterium]|jgi:predicted aldo/keto reductase-like oxidoreductase